MVTNHDSSADSEVYTGVIGWRLNMDNQEISLFAFAMRYGVIGGLVVVAVTLLFFLLDMSTSPIPQLISYAVMLGIILWGQWEYKKKNRGQCSILKHWAWVS